MTKVLHQLTKNVKLLQKAALIHKGRILILRRAIDAHSRANCWDLPGGNSEWPVAGDQGWGQLRRDLIREIAEETSVKISPGQLFANQIVYADTFFQPTSLCNTTELFSLILGWRVNLEMTDRPLVRLGSEHQQFAWILVAKLDDYDFGGLKGEFVKQIFLEAARR